MTERVCEWKGCRASLELRRSDARFCSNLCRQRAWQAKHPEAGYRPVRNGSRRTSRDGSGVRIYITTADDRASVLRKWQEALERIEERQGEA